MNILYVGMEYDYGIRERGRSFEHYNFYDTLARMGHTIYYFDFKALESSLGPARMNRRLGEIVRSDKPDLMFTFLYEEELDKRTVRSISEDTGTVTLNWFADDHWRFNGYSRYWAPCFNWVVTTAQSAVPKYAAIGYRNVIKSQWGFNPHLYRRNPDLALRYHVTFVGQPHGNRRMVVDKLAQEGIRVNTWGHGWEAGRISQEDMIRVFNQSRINLNLPNASSADWRRPPPEIVSRGRRALGGQLERFALGRTVKALRRQVIAARSPLATLPEQIKARNFEIPGCGGFQLSGEAEDLDQCFDPGREIVLFADVNDLVEKIQYYLAREDERAVIATAGHARALRDHTYQARFHDIFSRIGLSGT